MLPQPDWSQAREDLRLTLDLASKCGGGDGATGNGEFLGVPVLVVIPVKDSTLQRDSSCEDAAAFESTTREEILKDAWEGLGLQGVAERGFSFRVALVGLHEFESASKAAAAMGEGLVFAGGLEDACSKDVAAKLAELAGAQILLLLLFLLRGKFVFTGVFLEPPSSQTFSSLSNPRTRPA